MSVIKRRGDDLTSAFVRLYNDDDEITQYCGENLAEAFVNLFHQTTKDEALQELFIKADDAISTLLGEIWKRLSGPPEVDPDD